MATKMKMNTHSQTISLNNIFLNALAVQKKTNRGAFIFLACFILIKLISQQLQNKHTWKNSYSF